MAPITKKFRTSIDTGAKNYPAGAEVPIGKGGISAEEADRLETAFGIWTPETAADHESVITSLRGAVERADDETAALREAVTELSQSADALKLKNTQLAEEKAAVTAALAEKASELDVAEAKVAALEANLAAKAIELETAQGDAAALAAEVANLKAALDAATSKK